MKRILTGLLVICGMLGGCSARHVHHVKSPKHHHLKPKKWEPPESCHTLGMTNGTYTTVMIQHGCLKKGVTTISVFVHDTQQGGVPAAKESLSIIMFTLGFKPKLGVIATTKIKDKPLYLFVVLGAVD